MVPSRAADSMQTVQSVSRDLLSVSSLPEIVSSIMQLQAIIDMPQNHLCTIENHTGQLRTQVQQHVVGYDDLVMALLSLESSLPSPKLSPSPKDIKIKNENTAHDVKGGNDVDEIQFELAEGLLIIAFLRCVLSISRRVQSLHDLKQKDKAKKQVCKLLLKTERLTDNMEPRIAKYLQQQRLISAQQSRESLSNENEVQEPSKTVSAVDIFRSTGRLSPPSLSSIFSSNHPSSHAPWHTPPSNVSATFDNGNVHNTSNRSNNINDGNLKALQNLVSLSHQIQREIIVLFVVVEEESTATGTSADLPPPELKAEMNEYTSHFVLTWMKKLSADSALYQRSSHESSGSTLATPSSQTSSTLPTSTSISLTTTKSSDSSIYNSGTSIARDLTVATSNNNTPTPHFSSPVPSSNSDSGRLQPPAPTSPSRRRRSPWSKLSTLCRQLTQFVRAGWSPHSADGRSILQSFVKLSKLALAHSESDISPNEAAANSPASNGSVNSNTNTETSTSTANTSASTSSSSHFIIEALHFFEKIGNSPRSFPSDELPSIIQILCYAVNIESQAAWFVLRSILAHSKTTCDGMSTILSLLDTIDLYKRNPSANVQLLAKTRGVIFTLGMALWGSGRIQHLRVFWVEALTKLSSTVKKSPPSIVFEVALSIHRLVRKFGDDIHTQEMQPLISTISNMIPHLTSQDTHTADKLTIRLRYEIQETLSTLSNVITNDPFSIQTIDSSELRTLFVYTAHLLPDHIAQKNALCIFASHWQPLTLPHSKKWTATISLLLKEYFATFDNFPDVFVHHPSTRLAVLQNLTNVNGVLNITVNIKEWHNDLLDVLVPAVAAISRGKKIVNNYLQPCDTAAPPKYAATEQEELDLRLYAIDLLGLFALITTTDKRHKDTCLGTLEAVAKSGIDTIGGAASIRAIDNISRVFFFCFKMTPYAHSSVVHLLSSLTSIAYFFGGGGDSLISKTLSDESRMLFTLCAILPLARLRSSQSGLAKITGVLQLLPTFSPSLMKKTSGDYSKSSSSASFDGGVVWQIYKENEHMTTSLTASFVYFNAKTSHGTTIQSSPILALFTALLRVNSQNNINVEDSSCEERNAVISLCYLSQVALLNSGANSTVGNKNSSIQEILDVCLFDSHARQSIEVAKRAAHVLGAIAGSLSFLSPQQYHTNTDVPKIAAKLLDCCRSETYEIVCVGARGICCLVANSNVSIAHGSEHWTHHVCSVVIELLTKIVTKAGAPTTKTPSTTSNSTAANNSLISIPLLSVIFDIFSSFNSLPPNANLRLSALLLCGKICCGTNVCRQHTELALQCAAVILRRMSPTEARTAATKCYTTNKSNSNNNTIMAIVFNDLLMRAPGMSKRKSNPNHFPHELYKRESEDVENFRYTQFGAWLSGNALVSCRVGVNETEIVVRSSTGRVRWLMGLAGGSSGNSINTTTTTSTSTTPSKQLSHALSPTTSDIVTSPQISPTSLNLTASTPMCKSPSPTDFAATTTSPIELNYQDILLKASKVLTTHSKLEEEKKRSFEQQRKVEEEEKKKTASKSKFQLLSTKAASSRLVRATDNKHDGDNVPNSPSRRFRQTRAKMQNLSEGVAEMILSEATAETAADINAEMNAATTKRRNSLPDFSKLIGDYVTAEDKALIDIKRFITSILLNADMEKLSKQKYDTSAVYDETVERVANILWEDFGYNKLEELGDLNDEEVEELLELLVPHGIKLAHRQKLRRGLHKAHDSSVEVPENIFQIPKRRNSNTSNGSGGSGTSRRGSRVSSVLSGGDKDGESIDPDSAKKNSNSVNENCAPQMSIEFLLENFFNYNSNMGEFPSMVLLQNSLPLKRAIKILDRTPPLQTHKIALLYRGSGGNEFEHPSTDNSSYESAMLSATSGSPQYDAFMRSLGTFVPVRELTFYSGGLDTSEEMSDGEMALIWMSDSGRDASTDNAGSGNSMLVIHAPTAMPPNYVNRKRHVGNDSVHIIFVDEGGDEEIEEQSRKPAVSGQFGIVTIYVHPLANSSSFRVNVLCNRPDLSHLCGVSVVGEKNAGTFVRNLAVRSDIGVRSVIEELGQENSNWEERINQIASMRERFS